jgi:hypothetical protein
MNQRHVRSNRLSCKFSNYTVELGKQLGLEQGLKGNYHLQLIDCHILLFYMSYIYRNSNKKVSFLDHRCLVLLLMSVCFFPSNLSTSIQEQRITQWSEPKNTTDVFYSYMKQSFIYFRITK